MDHNVVHGVDYHRMTWEKRALDLDDLSSSADHLLTGNFNLRKFYTDLQSAISCVKYKAFLKKYNKRDCSM